MRFPLGVLYLIAISAAATKCITLLLQEDFSTNAVILYTITASLLLALFRGQNSKEKPALPEQEM